MKKKPISFLMLFCFLMSLCICRLDANASETLKKVSFTTKSQIVDDLYSDVTVNADLGFTNDLYGDTNKYNVTVTITPVYNSVWVRSDSGKANLATEPLLLNLINEKTDIYCVSVSNVSEIKPVYNSKGLVNSFSQTLSSVTSYDLKYFSFRFEPPDAYGIESIFAEYGEDLTINSVQYSVKFKVTASISLKSGSSPSVKLNKKSVSGYVNNIYYLTEIVANQQGSYKIVKAKSSNSSVASVSSSTGKITLKKPGTCTITVTNGYGRSASFKVKVKSSTISRQRSSVSCNLGTEMNLEAKGAVLLFGTPKYTVKSSNSSVVSVRKSGNQPIIRGKKTGSAVLTFTCGTKKFSIRVKVSKAKIVLASSVTLEKGDSRTLSANESSDGIYIKKVTSINGLLSVKISSDARSVTLKANKSFSGTSASDKVVVTFSNGTKKTIKVKITKPKTTKKFSLKDVKIKLKRSYWNDYDFKACLEYTITNNSSKDLTKLKVFYSGAVNEDVSGYININYSIPRGTSKTFTTRFGFADYIEGVTLKLVSAS